MKLRRQDLLKGGYNYPTGLINLKQSKHFAERLEERGIGVDCIPSMVRVTDNNIHSANCDDGKNLDSVVVRLDYNSYRYIFICFNPYDGQLKTLWFLEKKRDNGNRRIKDSPTNREPTVQDNRREDEI